MTAIGIPVSGVAVWYGALGPASRPRSLLAGAALIVLAGWLSHAKS